MRLALVRRGYSSTGGAEAYLKRFATALAAAGHQPVLFTGPEWPETDWLFEVRRLNGGRSPLQFAQALQSSHPEKESDLVFSLERVFGCDVYRAGDGVHAAWLERRARYEPRWKSWARRFSRKHAALCALERSMFQERGARLVIANSRLVMQEITDRFGYPASQVRVIYNGVPPAPSLAEQAELRAATRSALGLQDDEYTLLFAGSGWERKGLRFAIEAVEKCRSSRVSLLVAGRGKEQRMPKSDRVRYLGPLRGLAPTLAAVDAFILPTIYDPFSNACLEAMAAGLPVITTKANGFAEVIEPDEGTAVEFPDAVAELAAAIEQWADPARRDAIRPRLREKGARFSIEKNLRETLAAIEGLAPHPGPGG